MRNKRNVGIIVAAVVVIAAIIIAAVTFSNRDENEVTPPASDTSTAPQQEPASPSVGGEDTPGARIGNKQRSWPETSGQVNDSGHEEVGQYSADPLGRPVWTPVTHDGDLPAMDQLVKDTSPKSCESDTPALEGKTQIQYANARYLAVNEKYGPSKVERGVPKGYSRNQMGAVMAAMNQMVYGLYAQGDEIGYELDKELWSTSATAQEEREFLRLDEHPPMASSRAQTIPAASAFRVVKCSDSVVTVEVAVEGAASAPIVVARVPMVWKGGDWKADFSGTADTQMMQPDVSSLQEFSEVTYS